LLGSEVGRVKISALTPWCVKYCVQQGHVRRCCDSTRGDNEDVTNNSNKVKCVNSKSVGCGTHRAQCATVDLVDDLINDDEAALGASLSLGRELCRERVRDDPPQQCLSHPRQRSACASGEEKKVEENRHCQNR